MASRYCIESLLGQGAFGNDSVAGRATTTLQFATFKLTKPSLARLLSVDDKIELEIEFRCKRTTT